MKLKVLILSLLGLVFFSCKEESEKSKSVNKTKTFTIGEHDSYMLHSAYPNEAVKWEKVIASFNTEGGPSSSAFLINFNTGNFLNKHEIDSAFVILKPFANENLGNGKVAVSILKDKYKNTYNWTNKPAVFTDNFAVLKSVKKGDSEKVEVDVTNLVKQQAHNYGFDLPLYFALYDENPTEPSYASFYSYSKDLKKFLPQLKVYYKN